MGIAGFGRMAVILISAKLQSVDWDWDFAPLQLIAGPSYCHHHHIICTGPYLVLLCTGKSSTQSISICMQTYSNMSFTSLEKLTSIYGQSTTDSNWSNDLHALWISVNSDSAFHKHVTYKYIACQLEPKLQLSVILISPRQWHSYLQNITHWVNLFFHTLLNNERTHHLFSIISFDKQKIIQYYWLPRKFS